MSEIRSAAGCRWATPTLFLAAPYWFEAEDSPWACVRDAAPRVLTTTDACASCPRWEPRPTAAPADSLEQERFEVTHVEC